MNIFKSIIQDFFFKDNFHNFTKLFRILFQIIAIRANIDNWFLMTAIWIVNKIDFEQILTLKLRQSVGNRMSFIISQNTDEACDNLSIRNENYVFGT